MKAAKGHVFKYGDNVDTDVIIPARYLNSSDPKELALHCMEDIDKDFVKMSKLEISWWQIKLWMRFIQRACSDFYKGSRSKLCYCRDICTYFLP